MALLLAVDISVYKNINLSTPHRKKNVYMLKLTLYADYYDDYN